MQIQDVRYAPGPHVTSFMDNQSENKGSVDDKSLVGSVPAASLPVFRLTTHSRATLNII